MPLSDIREVVNLSEIVWEPKKSFNIEFDTIETHSLWRKPS